MSPGSFRLAAVLGVALSGAAAGCAGSDAVFEGLPAEPIAFVLRNVQETERILDEVEAERDAAQKSVGLDQDVVLQGVERLGRDESASVRDQQGRVALYVAPEQRFELPESLARGVRPLDWSPDHTRLLFSWAQRDILQLFEWIVASGEVRQLTTGALGALDGAYGPAGALVWVQREHSNVLRIWVRRPGEAPRPVTAGPRDLQPVWSPDGARIVYSAARPNQAVTLDWVEPATGASGSFGRGRSAAYSPDGEWIAYAVQTRAGWRLWRMRADGTGKRPFGESGYEENDPSFSPDGRFVVFAARKNRVSPVSRLFVRSFDGTHDRQLEFPGSGLLPVW